MTDFIDYQRRMWHWLTYFGVCRFYIDRDEEGNYIIKKAGPIRLILYYAYWINTLIKISYLILTYRGYLVEVHFLDQMSIWDWLLGFSEVVQECNMWYRKYPLFEILHANWKIQEKVFRKLGCTRTRKVGEKILRNDGGLVYLHTAIVVVGCSSLVVQLLSAPKYALNTYAVIGYDSWFLEFIFDTHEVIHMFFIWANQASSVVLCEVFACTYTHIIIEMRDVLEKLVEKGKPLGERQSLSPSTSGVRAAQESEAGYAPAMPNVSTDAKLVQRYLDRKSKVDGTDYDIMSILQDYKAIMLATNEFNNWAGKLQGGTTVSNYGQFISDVFMIFQLLKEPDTDVMAVAFFIEDACAGMIVLFRMLILLSRLYPASEEFLNTYKKYLTHDMHDKKYLRKYKKTLKVIGAKLGGCSVKGITVPVGINALMNYYIMAAMWKRPVDRLT